MGFEQRAAKLVEDFCNPAFRLRTISIDEVLEIDPIEVLHRIVKNSLGGPSIIVDGDGVWIVEIAGDLDFLFEAVDGCLIDSLDIQELDRTLPAQHRMMPSVDGSHRSFAELDIEAILSELFGFDSRLPSFPLQTTDDDGEGQNRHGRQGQEPEHGVKGASQNIQGLKGFVVVDLGDQTKRIILEPRPNSDDRYASIVAVSSDIDPIFLIHQLRRCLGEGQLASPRLRSISLGHVSTGLAKLDIENRLGVVSVGKYPEENQVLVEPTARDHQTLGIDRVSLAGATDAPELDQTGEFAIGSNAQRQRCDDL